MKTLLAIPFALALAGCQSTLDKVNAGIAEADRYVKASCPILQTLAAIGTTAGEEYLTPRQRTIIAQIRAVHNTACLQPVRDIPQVAILVASAIKAAVDAKLPSAPATTI